MGYILCTAEKPSVAKEIANVLGATIKRNGYYEGNGYRVTWAVGHLVGLAEPQSYGYMSLGDMWDKDNPQNKEIALNELPLFPNDFKLIVLEKTRPQFEIMKQLMNDDECDYIIDCGDSGAEGHILQWFIRVMAGCQKKVKRFIAQSMTEEKIKEAMADLQDIEKYKPIIAGEFCKKKADWILGMSMSRCESILYNAKVDVGRVQSPTLYFVIKRFLEVANFKVTDYFSFKAEFKKGFSLFWNKDTTDLLPNDEKDSENRLLNKTKAELLTKELKSLNKGKITALETKNRATDRPQLYDITELERDGNILFGYTAEEVLQTAQSLYEIHKITTYPRTDSRYITTDLVPYLKPRLKDIATHSKYTDICNNLLSGELNIDKKIVDNEKVTDHHAIIVTDMIANYDLTKLNEKESNILHLIITRILVALSDKYKYKETIIEVTFNNGMKFNAKGKIPIELGWKEVQKKLSNSKSPQGEEIDGSEEQVFKDVSLGEEIELDNIFVVPKKTTPPKYHTEATLLTAMENAGATIENGSILKGKGIGTQATRASIIKSLFDKKYVKTLSKGKTNYLIPTKQGLAVIKVLPSDLYSPKITADWENQIEEIVQGKLTEEQFMSNFKKFINEKIDYAKNHKLNVDFSYEKDIVGKCIWCKSDIYNGSIEDKEGNKIDTMYCSNKECKCSIMKNNLIFKMRTQKNLTTNQMKKLITEGEIETICISKQNVKYKGIFKLVKNDKGYAELNCSLPQKNTNFGKKLSKTFNKSNPFT